MAGIKINDVIKVHYVGKFENGNVFDSSEHREPLEFKVGEGNLIPGFENSVLGMKPGEKKTINIPAEEAYGETYADLIQEIEKQYLPEDILPEVGMELVTQTQEGQELYVTITEVRENSVIIDGNHPLAGKNLVFDITVIEVL